jgi:hypothetical protein
MSYDCLACIASGSLRDTTAPSLRRAKLTVDVYGRDNARKDTAKQQATDCTGLVSAFPETEYLHPGNQEVIGGRGIGLSFEWRLVSPFFSRADIEMDVFDNPLSRDSLTLRPILRASGAKGMLGHVLRQNDETLAEELLGPCVKKMQSPHAEGSAGSLVVGDVVFDKVGVDIFSPHERRFGVVDHPVSFEVVPEGAKAEWGLMLWERMPGTLDTPGLRARLNLILGSARDLLLSLGMSAKRTSGYGMAEPASLVIRFTPGPGIQVLGLPTDDDRKPVFPEPEPLLPKDGGKLGQWHRALIINDVLVEREKAVDTLVEAQSRIEKKTNPKQIANLRKDWGKKDKARKTWDVAKAILENFKPEQQAADERLRKEHADWKRRQADFDRKAPASFMIRGEQAFEQALGSLAQWEVKR